MEVTKVKITRDYEFCDFVYRKGTVFYVSEIYRVAHSTVDRTDLYHEHGEKICSFSGHWFDYANKTLFERCDPLIR